MEKIKVEHEGQECIFSGSEVVSTCGLTMYRRWDDVLIVVGSDGVFTLTDPYDLELILFDIDDDLPRLAAWVTLFMFAIQTGKAAELQKAIDDNEPLVSKAIDYMRTLTMQAANN